MPEFPTLRHTISDIRMRYAPDRATAKGACSDFSYLYRSNLQHRHDPADRIHTTPPHPRVSPRHGRNHGQPAAAARRRAGASLHQTHLRRSFDQRKRRSRRPHGPLGHLRPAGPRARILLRPHARRRRRHAGACQIDAHGRRADDTRHTGPAQPRHMAGHLPLRIPQPRFGPPHRRHPNRIVRPQFRRQADALAEKLHLPETDHQTRESNDDSDKTQDRGPAHRRRAARTARLGIRDSRNARIPARGRRARTGRRSLLPLCARQQKGGSGPAYPRQGGRIRRKRTESGHPQLGRGVTPRGTPERAKAGARTPRPSLSATAPDPDSGPHTPNRRTASSVSGTKNGGGNRFRRRCRPDNPGRLLSMPARRIIRRASATVYLSEVAITSSPLPSASWDTNQPPTGFPPHVMPVIRRPVPSRRIDQWEPSPSDTATLSNNGTVTIYSGSAGE